MVGSLVKVREVTGTETSHPSVNDVTKMDYESVWRFVWDDIIGYNIADPNFFTLYFYNVSIPVPGGVA